MTGRAIASDCEPSRNVRQAECGFLGDFLSEPRERLVRVRANI